MFELKCYMHVSMLFDSGYNFHMEGLNALVDEFGDDLYILGVPSNNFGLAEPGANSELMNCYEHVRPGGGFVPKYDISVKVDVNGANEHDLYTFLKVIDRCAVINLIL